MEFGIFLQGHLPGPQAFDRGAEHRMIMQEVDYVVQADRNTHPPQLGHLQPLAPGEPSGAHRRASGDARPPERGPFEFGTGRGAGSHEVARVRSHRADQVCFGMPTNLAYDTAYTDRSTP